MKKNLMYFVTKHPGRAASRSSLEGKHFIKAVVLTLCLVGFAFAQIVSASPVHAASEPHPALSSTGPAEKEAVPLTHSTQPVVFVVTGLVCVLFGMITLSPLLIDDPVQVLHEANRAEGFPARKGA